MAAPNYSLIVPDDLLAAVQEAAAWRALAPEDYLRSVVETATRMDADLAASVQEGIDGLDRGEFVSQEEMEAWFEARHRSAAAE